MRPMLSPGRRRLSAFRRSLPNDRKPFWEVRMRRLLPVVVLMAAQTLGATSAQPIILWKNSREAVVNTVRAVPASNAARFALLRKYFDASECREKDLEEQPVPQSQQKNLICTLEGTTGGVIVLAAHYELEGKGASAVDDWSGAVMLPMICAALRASVPTHTFIFVEFAGSDGARAYLGRLSKPQRKAVL